MGDLVDADLLDFVEAEVGDLVEESEAFLLDLVDADVGCFVDAVEGALVDAGDAGDDADLEDLVDFVPLSVSTASSLFTDAGFFADFVELLCFLEDFPETSMISALPSIMSIVTFSCVGLIDSLGWGEVLGADVGDNESLGATDILGAAEMLGASEGGIESMVTQQSKHCFGL